MGEPSTPGASVTGGVLVGEDVEISLDIAGLLPATDYNYGIEVDSVVRLENTSRGRFRTFPQGAGSFRLAFASCGDITDSDQRAYAAIAAEQPLLFIHLGDFTYSDTNTTLTDDYRRNYDNVLSHAIQGALYRSVRRGGSSGQRRFQYQFVPGRQ